VLFAMLSFGVLVLEVQEQLYGRGDATQDYARFMVYNPESRLPPRAAGAFAASHRRGHLHEVETGSGSDTVEIAFLGMPCQQRCFICTTECHRSVSTGIILCANNTISLDKLVFDFTDSKRKQSRDNYDVLTCGTYKQIIIS
jgi:hypothetical protein